MVETAAKLACSLPARSGRMNHHRFVLVAWLALGVVDVAIWVAAAWLVLTVMR